MISGSPPGAWSRAGTGSRRLWFAAVCLFFAAYGLSLFGPVVLGNRALFWHDVSIAYLPLRTSAAEAIAAGHLPLWESRLGNGFPVLAEGQAGVFYPPHLLGYTGLPQYQVYAILVWLHCVLGAALMALFCRELGMRLMPCLLAGLTYGWSGFFITHVMHITMLEAAAWIPAMLLCLEKWLSNPRTHGWLVGAAAALALQELAAMPQIFFYSLLSAMLYLLVGAAGRAPADEDIRRPAWVGRVTMAAVAVALGAVLLAAVQVVPTKSLVGASDRETVTAEKLRELALLPRNLAYFVHPYLLGSYAEGNYFGRDHHYEVCGFTGTAALLFAILGGVVGRGRARVFALCIIPLSLFLALAKQNPLYEFLVNVPGFNWFRGAGRYVLLTGVGVSLLAAYGVQALGTVRRAPALLAWIGLLGLCLWAVSWAGLRLGGSLILPRMERVVGGQDTTPLEAREEAREKYEFLIERVSPADPIMLLVLLLLGLPAALCVAHRLRPFDIRTVGEAAVALALVQLFIFARDYNPSIEPSYYTRAPSLSGQIDRQAGHCLFIHDQNRITNSVTPKTNQGWAGGDLSRYWNEREFLRPNRQVLYDQRSANVFYALVPARYWDIDRLLNATLDGRIDRASGLKVARPTEVLRAMGVSVVCTADPDALSNLPVIRRYPTWVARRNPGAMPLAWFADRPVICPDRESALRYMASADFGVCAPAVEMESGAVLPLDQAVHRGKVISATNDFGNVRVWCQTREPSFLVVREMWDSHFQCLIDGQETPILRANYLYRGVVVPPGEHEVEFRYVAGDLQIGAAISGIAAALAVFLLLVSGRRKRQ
ncbi:MAG: hypothetical protein HPY44_17920 [Armatimonadetes bacterium]|nr:hypothetical protein [Armatimonadota bacterium]